MILSKCVKCIREAIWACPLYTVVYGYSTPILEWLLNNTTSERNMSAESLGGGATGGEDRRQEMNISDGSRARLLLWMDQLLCHQRAPGDEAADLLLWGCFIRGVGGDEESATRSLRYACTPESVFKVGYRYFYYPNWSWVDCLRFIIYFLLLIAQRAESV